MLGKKKKKLLRKQPELHLSLRVSVWSVHSGATVVMENGGRGTTAAGSTGQYPAGWKTPGLRTGCGAGTHTPRGWGSSAGSTEEALGWIQAAADVRDKERCQQLCLVRLFRKRRAGAGEESPGCFLGNRALIMEESCRNYKHRHGIYIRNQHRKALRSDLLLNTGQMSVRIPLALNV